MKPHKHCILVTILIISLSICSCQTNHRTRSTKVQTEPVNVKEEDTTVYDGTDPYQGTINDLETSMSIYDMLTKIRQSKTLPTFIID